MSGLRSNDLVAVTHCSLTMPLRVCRFPCGATLTTSGPIPHPDGLYVLREETFEARADAADFDLILESTGAHECRKCGRLWVWWNGWDNEPTVYLRELR